MNEHASAPSDKRHRFPPAIIAHAVWLYCRFALSYRDVEELLAERGVVVTYETVRQWCQKFGQTYANALRRRRSRPGDKWHLDEVFISINGVQRYLWRAVDQDGHVLDILVQSRRDKRAATKFLRKLLKGLTYVPRVVITDKLASYGAAMREVLPSVEHRRHKGSATAACTRLCASTPIVIIVPSIQHRSRATRLRGDRTLSGRTCGDGLLSGHAPGARRGGDRSVQGHVATQARGQPTSPRSILLLQSVKLTGPPRGRAGMRYSAHE